jgi:hypothetical protein
MDRLADIDGDLEDMKKRLKSDNHAKPEPIKVGKGFRFDHTPPSHFQPGKDLEIVAASQGPARLFYRHVNQAERWREAEMGPGNGGVSRAIIPADYTISKFSLQYYFSFIGGLQPGFGPDLAATPYYIVRP